MGRARPDDDHTPLMPQRHPVNVQIPGDGLSNNNAGLSSNTGGGGGDAATRKDSIYNIVIVSIAFLVLFTSYNSLQNVVTSLLVDNLGNISLSILYASVCVFVFITPPLIEKIGEKWTMVFGAACYVVYMASLIHIVFAVVCVAAVVIGLGASVLWVALGSFMTKCSAEENIGRNMGIFWGIFQLSNVFGNLGVFFLFANTPSSLFIVFAAVAGAGTLLLLFLRPPAPPAALDDPLAPLSSALPAVARRARSPKRHFIDTFRMLFSRKIALVAPIFFFSGVEMAFWTGEFPQLLDQTAIGLVLTFAGVGEVLGGLIFGRLSDRTGRGFTVVLGGFVYLVGLGLSAWLFEVGSVLPPPILEHASIVAYAASLCMGMGDSAFNTQIFSILQDMYSGDDSSMAFTLFNLFQNSGSAVGYYLSMVLPVHGTNGTLGQIWLQVALLIVGCSLFLVAERKHTTFRPQKP